MRTTALLCLIAAATAASSPASLLMERQMPHEWTVGHRSPRRLQHKLIFAVKQKNLDAAAELLSRISDPNSKAYGKHLTFAQVGTMVANKQGTAAVTAWLNHHKVMHRTTEHGEYVEARAPIGVWEHLLQATFTAYTREGDAEAEHRAGDYHLPQGVAEHVDHVFYATHLPAVDKRWLAPSMVEASQATGKVEPATLNKVYNIARNQASEGNYSIYESLGQNYSPDDLKLFQTQFSIPLNGVDMDIGGNDNSSVCKTNPNSCGEANLDVQYLMAVSQGPTSWYWSMNPKSDFADWITAVAGTADAPLVHSVSYGGFEEQIPTGNKASFETEAMKLGLRGVTVVVSSGDDGVSGFLARKGSEYCGYHPSWPASSLYVVSVGATMGPESGTAEVVCEAPAALVTTGGGFSDSFPAPAFQTEHISSYFQTAEAPFGPGYNTTGRGYPDVAMLGHAYQVVIGGKTFAVDGTSASAPVFAGVLSLVNDARLKQGKSAVGYATPTLYALHARDPTIFNDVTSGANNCAAKGINTTCCTKQGFYAAKGWDPLTGLGSVDVSKLIKAWSSLA